jgi:hypothetical protein
MLSTIYIVAQDEAFCNHVCYNSYLNDVQFLGIFSCDFVLKGFRHKKKKFID